ncbi:hypothetical protein Drose_03655 [Dactylosporangium roseum]|uniref:Uncharacterized protein n=1 Tax=Dactylosporangium roseum TaxID=47989 RepID=A0ABY5Z5R4_9ACTN|nr:hypothetical protein [Dactylosporangium roseum]UWZ37390.1 hypothetical protein Drose_03655 [Dactylosporangium roseum]
MSDWDTGDTGYDGGSDVDYGHYEAGQQHGELDQLHQVDANDSSYNSDFNVYEQDSANAESTDFQQGHNVQWTDGHGASYSETDFTNYSHDEASTDSIFAAEGSVEASDSQYSEIDALRQQIDSSFVTGTEFHGNAGGLGVASN